MLKILRNKKIAKKIWIFLAFIIIPAFTLWGFGSAFHSNEENSPVGKLFGRTVTALEFKDALDAVRTQAVLRFGEGYAQAQQHINFESEAINRLILLHEAKARRIKISDEEVVKEIENIPYFWSKGKFDQKNYNQIIQYGLRIQPRAFEEQMRQNMAIAKLYKDYTGSISLTDSQVKEEYRKQNKKISVYYLAASPADFTGQVSPSREELLEYYKKNMEQFKEGPFLNIEYLVLNDLQKAKEAAMLSRKKTELGKIAQRYGVELKATGQFSESDPIPGLGWSPVMSEMIGKLKVGQTADPLIMENRYYFLRLKEKKEAYIPAFEKIEVKVKDAFVKEKSEALAKERIESALKLDQEAPVKGDFGPIAKKTGLKAGATDLFQLNSYIEGIGASNKLWLEADKLKPEEISSAISMPTGFYLVKVKQSIEPETQKFNEEKEDFSRKLLVKKKQETFAKFLQALREKAQ